MAKNYKFPGVYSEINDLSGVVTINATTACAYVGQAEYGPVYKPTLLSSLQDYTNIFGSLSSKYGYAGYSLAVAADTIDEHQFVRVVPRGNTEGVDAKWAAASFMVDSTEESAPTSTGYFYDQIISAEEERDAGMPIPELFNSSDYDTAFIVTASDPNNRNFYVSLAETTINTNRAYAVEAVSLASFEESGEVTGTFVTVTTDKALLKTDLIKRGSRVTVSKLSNSNLNGIFVVTGVTTDSASRTIVTYFVPSVVTVVPTFASAKIGLYPDDEGRTFSVTVSELNGKALTTLEVFQYCTLFAAKDSYGTSTFIEDVINGTSNYIEVFVNTNISNADEAYFPKLELDEDGNNKKVYLAGGTSGAWESDEDKYTDLCEAWELFRDRGQVNASILMNSGYVEAGNCAYQNKMLEIAEARRDCFCLFDVPMTETSYEDAIEWRRNISNMNTYRAALCSPWVKTYDAAQGRANFIMCPSAYVAKIMGSSDPWVAPAGLNRGVITSSTVSPTGLTQYYNQTQGGILYADNQINCIIRDPGVGYVNWGQRTLQQKPSAMDRINVARTVIYIESILRDAARWHLFENNTAYERTQITLQFNSFLNTILSANGLDSFKVVCDETNNTSAVITNNQLVIDIYLIPVYTAETIILKTTVEAAGATIDISTNS